MRCISSSRDVKAERSSTPRETDENRVPRIELRSARDDVAAPFETCSKASRECAFGRTQDNGP